MCDMDIYLRDGSWVELIRDCGHQDDQWGAQTEAGQGEGGGGRHEEVSPGELGQDGEGGGEAEQAEANDGHQAAISDNRDISAHSAQQISGVARLVWWYIRTLLKQTGVLPC